MKRTICFLAVMIFINVTVRSQVVYPYPVQKMPVNIEGKKVNMAYMDIRPAHDSGSKTILLLHGKNFNGYYWKDLIPYLIKANYRIIVPDQIGWGQSDRPNLHYSFQLLANNTKILLENLGINKCIVLGHSMGGMLAIRFTLMYPAKVEKLILENPIGLEDYKRFVPYQPVDSLFKKERSSDYATYKKYQQTYYPIWLPVNEQYVKAQAADLNRPDFDNIAMVNAITYQMIYEQPVCYELDQIHVPTLLVIGQADRTVVGKEKLSENDKQLYGNYPLLGKITQEKISGSVLRQLDGFGHIAHVQNVEVFWSSIRDWIE